jgi:hypothetical protein
LIPINAAFGNLYYDSNLQTGAGSMRALCLIATIVFTATASSAQAETRWLQSGQLDLPGVAALCEQVRDVRLLARMQMIASGGEKWKRLSRQDLDVEAAMMGVPPLDPTRCYIIARAGPADDRERRAFEVRDFAVNPDWTSVFVVGRAYDAPTPVQPLDH